MSEKAEALGYGIVINVLVVGGAYWYVQPDDKGIGFGFFITFYGLIAALSGLLLQLKGKAINWTIGSLVMIANISNIFILWISIKSWIFSSSNFTIYAVVIISIYGCFIGIKLLYKYLNLP